MTADTMTTFALIAVMVIAFYLLIIRPTRNRQKAQAKTLESATAGTRVMTASGVIGDVVAMGDRQAQIEIAPGVVITVVKQAIVQVLNDDEIEELVVVDEPAEPLDTETPAIDDVRADDARPDDVAPARTDDDGADDQRPAAR